LEMCLAKSAPNSCPRTTAEVTTEVIKVDRSKAGTRKRRALAMEPRSQPVYQADDCGRCGDENVEPRERFPPFVAVALRTSRVTPVGRHAIPIPIKTAPVAPETSRDGSPIDRAFKDPVAFPNLRHGRTP
jgi:hypothetical protein